MSEIREFLERHLQSILDGDVHTYHATTVPDLSVYEWYVTPHRIDGLPFHDFMLEEARRADTATLALAPQAASGAPAEKTRMRFGLANYREQRYGDTVICSYTLLLSRATAERVIVISYNESRVLVHADGAWKAVHIHKSPARHAPFQPPRG